jgi:hypothetical protein
MLLLLLLLLLLLHMRMGLRYGTIRRVMLLLLLLLLMGWWIAVGGSGADGRTGDGRITSWGGDLWVGTIGTANGAVVLV